MLMESFLILLSSFNITDPLRQRGYGSQLGSVAVRHYLTSVNSV
jgi:hypothetical protein